MAECIVLKGGGGADLDVVTAGRPDVLAGKVIVDKDGEPLTGSMPNRGAVSAALNAGGSYSIPEGYHNGSGKIVANSLASQTPGNADRGSILEGRSAWVNGAKVDGSIPWQNVEIAGTDRAWSQGMSNWAGTINLKVRNGHYLSGVNWIQQNIPEYQPWNIKKGVNVAGVVGTFEGYVPTATDLYLRGNNIKGWTGNSYATFDSGQITITNDTIRLWTTKTITLTGYTLLNIQGLTNTNAGVAKDITLYQRVSSNEQNTLGYMNLGQQPSGNYTYSFNIASHQITAYIEISTRYLRGAIYRIWLS